MRIFFITIICCSFILPGTVYLSMDFQNFYKYESNIVNNTDHSFERGAIALGYFHPVVQLQDFSLSVGGELSISPFLDESSNNGDGDSYSEANVYSLYLLPNFSVTDDFNIWTKIGYGAIDIEHFVSLDPGMIFGIGMHHMLSEHIGIGFGYTISTAHVDMNEYQGGGVPGEIELKLSRLAFNLGYSF